MMKPVDLFLIDDDEDDRELFQYALRSISRPIQFSYACNGTDALDKLKSTSHLPDFIFLDLNMPGMNGHECLEAIKQEPTLKHIPVVIYSASSNPDHAAQAKALQAKHYLVKPNRTVELTEILNDILSGLSLPFLLQVKLGW